MKKSKLKIAVFLTALLIPFFGINFSDAVGVKAAGGTTYASKGTAVVDGIKDERYDHSASVTLGDDRVAKAEIYPLWDENYLYVFADITDKSISHIDPEVFKVTPWYSDSLEVFVDRELARSTDTNMPYGSGQLRIDTDNNVSGMHNGVIWAGKENHFEGLACQNAAKIWDDGQGYSVEFAIPLSISAPDGVTYRTKIDNSVGSENKRGSIGYDLMLNNAIDSSTRQDTYTWSAGVGAPAGWNTLLLMDEVPEDLRSKNAEKVSIPGDTNVAPSGFAYTDTVPAFEMHTYYAVDNNMQTYTQGLSAFWSLTVDFRYELEIAKVVVKTHKDTYPTKFKVEYYNSRYNEWETLWDTDNVTGTPMTCLVADQIGKYYITSDTVMTRFMRFVPYGSIVNLHSNYSYALCEFQTFTPDRIQIVDKISDKDMPIDISDPTPNGNVTENVPADQIVDTPLRIKTVSMVPPYKIAIGISVLVISVSIFALVAIIYIKKHKKERSK